uniref:Heat shock factor binding protein 1 n=1 Tax=Peronospora matthiolae TaxID=2874970 RepID=A0AAV1TXC9_9STRA
MGSRVDELEKSIGGLMEQASADGNDKNQQEPTAPAPKEG